MLEGFVDESLQGSQEACESPGLRAGTDLGWAFELKLQLPAAEAQEAEAWARQHLTPDPHGLHGVYRITSIYCDTAALDVFHRSPGFRRRKFRVRRYGSDTRLYLERKSKKGDKVRKLRTVVCPEELALLTSPDPVAGWGGEWFRQRIHRRSLQPTCRVGYQRTAFFGLAADSPIRLTLDRNLVGVPARDWEMLPLHEGHLLLPGSVLLELKFHVHLPGLFRDLLSRLPGQPVRGSKYRQCVQLCGLEPATNGHIRLPETATRERA